MKHPILLKRFEYSIPDSDTTANGTDHTDRSPFEMHLPLVKVNIDFEKSNLSLEGNGLFIMDHTRKPKPPMPISGDGRVRVKAIIHPGFSVDLSDFSAEGLVFSLDGIIDDGKSIHTCSGLLVLDKTISRDMPGSWEWYLTVYIYDDYSDEREIKLKLTMYSISENANLN
jgi:hypothetical protein